MAVLATTAFSIFKCGVLPSPRLTTPYSRYRYSEILCLAFHQRKIHTREGHYLAIRIPFKNLFPRGGWSSNWDDTIGGLGGPPNHPAHRLNGMGHAALMARNMMSNHTDMKDKYCGDCYDIHPIQRQYTKVAACGRHHKRGGAAFGRVTTILVLHVGVIGHHVPRH